ncbi:hypothetical protein SCLCIDRAFT_782178 [Scleroderma citrinum Foug A]|uniref:Uncharacterized protein n=1 Tax=Scleroderma citrinum Foug A TaxID=1036808 RepID=A0A0C3AD96_9AGAM|nr:hypothetical protein SCLCIDRAFT_782178 [Scleroderma citrinum Foug A]
MGNNCLPLLKGCAFAKGLRQVSDGVPSSSPSQRYYFAGEISPIVALSDRDKRNSHHYALWLYRGYRAHDTRRNETESHEMQCSSRYHVHISQSWLHNRDFWVT